eukprot:952108-Prymnesium_polylepis.1
MARDAASRRSRRRAFNVRPGLAARGAACGRLVPSSLAHRPLTLEWPSSFPAPRPGRPARRPSIGARGGGGGSDPASG